MGKKAAPLVYPLGLWASLLGIIQGLVWTIFSIIALLLYYKVYVHDPQFDSYSNQLTSTIYILYFNNDLLNVTGLVVNDDVIVTPDVFVIFSWIYLFLSFIWFCWSCWQLWVILHKKLKFVKTSFVTWSVLGVFVAILDVVFISLLANDYTYYLDYYNSYAIEEGVSVSIYIILACGIALSCAARGYLLWIINVIFISVLIKIVVSGVEEDSYERHTDRGPINAFAPARNPNQSWSETNQSQSNNTTDAWISNPTAIINEAFDFMGEDKPPPGFHRSQSLSTIQNGTALQNGGIKSSSPLGSYKVATVGRKGISATTLAPFIPEPDYSPPASPASKRKPVLKSVLKNRSHYA